MRHITKSDAPAELRDWLDAENEAWTPTWSAFGGAEKAATKTALLAEQGSLCAYCCERIDADTSHVEHVVPRSASTGDPSRALDYQNLVASCFGQDDEDPRLRRGAEPDRHCGDHKGSTFDASRFVSPLDLSCETAFAFTSIGRVEPTAEGLERADYTFRVLNLNAARLVRGRTAAITGIEVVLTGLDVEARRSLLARLADRRPDGAFAQFYPAVVSALSYLAPS